MAAITSTVVAGIGLGTAAYGAVTGASAGKKAQQAQAQITAASVRAEALRAQQMRLEGFRRQRETIRQMLVARATGVSNASSSGAMQSSGFQGALAEIAGRGTQSLVAQGENSQIGEGLFSANRDKMMAELNLSSARTDQSTSNGLFSLGSAMVNSASTFGNVAQGTNRDVPASSAARANS